MVHRNVPNKLGIQAEHVKTDKANIKKPSIQHHDIKDRGVDLKKKKVKKSAGSLKSAETKHPLLSNVKRKIKQPGKPPPENNAATQRKLSPIRVVMDTTPNYMKPTTSSDARNESDLQVSSRSPQTSYCKSLIRRNSLNSNQKPTLTSASKALITNLIISPSFKPIRTSAKKCSPMTLCKNLQIQRATCSSTIKGHKFPAYLTLSPGETEAGGTSSMKVCPYSYCSLHGNHHHHDVLPPLKSYMLAKRRILIKAQRNMKLGCLSPRRKKPIQENIEKEEVQLYDSQEHPPTGNASMFQEDHGEYFIEIYGKEIRDLSLRNQDRADFAVSDFNISVDVRDEYATDDRKDQQSSLDDPPFHSFSENNHNIGVFEKVYTPKSAQGKEELDFLDFIYEMEVERTPSIQSEETGSQDYYVELRNAGVDTGGSHPGSGMFIQINDKIDLEKANSPLDSAFFLYGAGEVCYDSLTSEIMQDSSDNEIAYEAWSGDDDSELVTSHQNIWISNGIIYDDQNHNRIGTDESDDHLNEMVTVDPTSLKIDGHGIGMINGAQFDDAFLEQTNQEESKDFYDMGSQAFEKPHSFEKLTNSIATQTENGNEDHHDMSWKIYKVQKRSIGTQTDFEDQGASSMLNEEEEEETQSIDGIEEITLLRPAGKDANQTVTGENGNDNVLFADEDMAKESGLNESVQDLVHPGIDRTQVESGIENKENQIGGCSPRAVVKINRIIKGKKKVIIQNGKEMEFKPKAPNFLSVEPDPDAEKVDLRHLTLDEKKNEDEWMVDYALQQALTKLATPRKRKVALLVQAFETVTPTPNESRVRVSSTAFA